MCKITFRVSDKPGEKFWKTYPLVKHISEKDFIAFIEKNNFSFAKEAAVAYLKQEVVNAPSIEIIKKVLLTPDENSALLKNQISKGYGYESN